MSGPFVVGICGGIGSGKSAVTRAFRGFGATVIDADALAHEILDEPPVLAAILARFGKEAVQGGMVNRTALGRMIFGATLAHTQARRDLERIVHPRVLFRIEAALDAARAADPQPKVVVLDVPLLIESPLRHRCDAIVFVDAPDSARLERTRNTRGWTAEEHLAREAAQAPVAARRAAATVVLDNSGTLADLERRCAALYRRFTESP